MGLALAVTTGFVTAPSAVLTAATMAAGDSLVVKNANPNSKIWLLSLWANNQVAGVVRLRSPKLHDNVQGIHFQTTTNAPLPLLPKQFKQPLYAQDSLILEQSGSAVGGQIESAQFLTYYEDLPGAAARLASPADVMGRMVNLVTVKTSHVGGITGGYSGAVALNSTDDLLKANTDYAVIGYEVDVSACGVHIFGPDTGNLRIGGPCNAAQKEYTRNYFERLSFEMGLPCIPVINSANKGATTCDIAINQAGGTVIANWILAELAGAPVR